MAKMNVTQYAAFQRLTQHRQDMQSIRRQLQSDLSAGREFFDPNLNEQGLVNQRERLVTAARERAAQATQKLQTAMVDDTATVRRWAEEQRPRISEDVVGLMRSQQAWERAKSLLESGRSLPTLLASADRDMVLAAQEWWPTWTAVRTGADPDRRAFQRSIDARLAELDPGFGEAAKALTDLEGASAGFDMDVRTVDAAAAGGPLNGLQAAFDAHYGEQFARAGIAEFAADEAVA